MKKLKLLVVLFLFLSAPAAFAQNIIWVGNSAACTAIGTSNPAERAYPDFELALTMALISFNQADEIRLTNTVNYNLAENRINIANFTNGPGPFSSGPLEVKGGYANCGNSQSSSTVIPQAVSVSLDSASNESTVTISDITIQRSNATGMFISGALEFGINVNVFLENVRIDAGRRGITITDSAKVVMDSNTVIENHSHPTIGGGLYCGNIAEVEVNGARFENNIAPRGGQLYVDLGCSVNVREGSDIIGVLFDNPPALQGAGIYVDSGFLRVWGGSNPALIRNNYGDEGSGIFCTGTANVVMEGRLLSNWARFAGGNIYATDGCNVELTSGAVVENGTGSGFGGGIFLSGNAFLEATGSQDGRVVIRDNFSGRGGGLYIQDMARAELYTTLFLDNDAIDAGAIWIEGEPTNDAVQLLMDRVDCPFLISCSELQGNSSHDGAAIWARDSNVVIRRTLFDRNDWAIPYNGIASGVITLIGTDAEIDRVGFIGNEAYATIANTTGPQGVNIRHVTAVDNTFPSDPARDAYALSVRGVGTTTVHNSIFMDTDGHDSTPSGTFSGGCNLVDDQSSWPASTTILGTAIFNNAAGGDIRQQSSSPGVDMCAQAPGITGTELDIELQEAPVNDFTNPQGRPGDPNGLWDAGFDEVYSNIGDDNVELLIEKSGSGEGIVFSAPTGIVCGADCSELYFQGDGTVVTLFAGATGGSTFEGWIGCPLINGDDECLVAMTDDITITAVFSREDAIFSDRFE
jgi:hypothetical protein